MCLAVPLRIQKIEGVMADVELGGVMRQVSLMLTPEAHVGDYVLVHTGFAISVLDEQEAQETLALFAELEEATRQLEQETLPQVEEELPPAADKDTAG
jgi:hydrogenase expression/formation protein HypC